MKRYEVMIIIKPTLSEDEKKALFSQISDAVTKNNGTVSQANVWLERRKLYFPVKKCQEGMYYLMSFSAPTEAIVKIRNVYGLNENILRVLVTCLE
jgi:small subunit ribosomal protein S6